MRAGLEPQPDPNIPEFGLAEYSAVRAHLLEVTVGLASVQHCADRLGELPPRQGRAARRGQVAGAVHLGHGEVPVAIPDRAAHGPDWTASCDTIDTSPVLDPESTWDDECSACDVVEHVPSRGRGEVMALRVNVSPGVLRWARERAGVAGETLLHRFPKYRMWESGDAQPTYRQLQEFAKVTHTPFGMLLLPDPPEEEFPIPDFRTVGSVAVAQPSVNLRETVYLCQLRQDWYRHYALSEGLDRVALVGSATLSDPVDAVAARVRKSIGIDVADRAQVSTWSDVLRHLIRKIEEAGILVMISGIVGNNSHRKLDPGEFRGLALVDDLAPLIFVNGADAKAAQMFTVAHEIAHLCLGRSALSNPEMNSTPTDETEAWCNQFAAELLVPAKEIRAAYSFDGPLTSQIRQLAGRFKVSTLVVLRRLFDISAISAHQFRIEYRRETTRFQKQVQAKGGNFFATQTTRSGERFTRALVIDTLEGRTLYRDAFDLLGFKKVSTFNQLADRLGVS